MRRTKMLPEHGLRTGIQGKTSYTTCDTLGWHCTEEQTFKLRMRCPLSQLYLDVRAQKGLVQHLRAGFRSSRLL